MPEAQENHQLSSEYYEKLPSFQATNQRSNSEANPSDHNQIAQGQGQAIEKPPEEAKLEVQPVKKESRKMSVG